MKSQSILGRIRAMAFLLRLGVLIGMVWCGSTCVDAAPVQPPSTMTPDSARDYLSQIEKQIGEHLPKLKGAVVCIQAGGGSGSGVIVSEDGLILTAAHVIDKATDLTIVFQDGRSLRGKSLGTYGPADAGMAQLLEGGPHPFVEVAPPASFAIHDPIFALGHPGGFDLQRGTPLRIGHIRQITDAFIENDAALIGGDSGGPTFDLQGRVIGIHSHITEQLHLNSDANIGAFHQAWEAMKKGEHHSTHYSKSVGNKSELDPWILGLKLVSGSDARGLSVEGVLPKSPAAEGGIVLGDLLMAANAEPIEDAEAFFEKVARGEYGEKLVLQVLRDQQTIERTLSLLRQSDFQKLNSQTLDSVSDANDKDAKEPRPSASSLSRPASEQRSPKQPEGEKSSPAEAPRSRLQQLQADAKANGGKMKLNRDELQRLRRELGQRTESLVASGGSRVNDPWTLPWQTVCQAWDERYSQSVHRVYVGGKWVGTAVAVSIDGRLITKASEIQDRDFEIEVAQEKRQPGRILAIEPGLDLAMVAIPATVLQPMSLERTSRKQEMGALCFSLGYAKKLAGFGVISVSARPLDGKTGAMLGLQVEAKPTGLEVISVRAGTPASRAGIVIGDVVNRVDGKVVTTPDELQAVVQSHLAGETLRIDLQRGDSLFSLPIVLVDGSKLVTMPGAREQAIDGATTAMSKRRWGFSVGIQHDGAIHPRDCGSPLVDLDGNLIGINIARAGRIHSYAIPIDQVRDFVKRHEDLGLESSLEVRP